MTARIIKNFVEVGNRLDELGTSRDFMLEVADAMVAASAECTENDPNGSRGWRGWQMGTRRNRELHCGQSGWEKDETDQIPSIVNIERGIKIVVCNTDDGTCVDGRIPQNRSRKGPATVRLIDNNQLAFFDRLDRPHPDSVVVTFAKKMTTSGSILTYYLCVYHGSDDVRVELSCFVNSSGGFFGKAVEQIYIFGGSAGPVERKRSDDDDGSEFDIQVKRKK